MRKFLFILSVIFLTFPFLGYHFWFLIKQSEIKREVKWKMLDGIDKKLLVHKVFSHEQVENTLNWKHSKEFEHKGEWYDVVYKEIKGDSVHFYLWWDHEETALCKQLNTILFLTVDQTPYNQKNKKNLLHYHKSFYTKSNLFKLNCFKKIKQKSDTVYKTINFSSPYIKVETPPPIIS